jgi:hypothetical protein
LQRHDKQGSFGVMVFGPVLGSRRDKLGECEWIQLCRRSVTPFSTYHDAGCNIRKEVMRFFTLLEWKTSCGFGVMLTKLGRPTTKKPMVLQRTVRITHTYATGKCLFNHAQGALLKPSTMSVMPFAVKKLETAARANAEKKISQLAKTTIVLKQIITTEY